MRLAAMVALAVLLAGLLGAATPARADTPPESNEPQTERWSADPRLWRALIEWRQRLRLELTSSRELCTAGTLTEISWAIAGGAPPYSLQVEGASVAVDGDNIRINCGPLTEAEAADEEAELAAKRITAVVTDSRGVRREAAIDIARARALPAPQGLEITGHRTMAMMAWDREPSARTDTHYGCNLVRWRAATSEIWAYVEVLDKGSITFDRGWLDLWDLTEGTEYVAAAATMRDEIEVETPDALDWSDTIRFTTAQPPQNLTATATYDTITVSWDAQSHDMGYVAYVYNARGAKSKLVRGSVDGRRQAVFSALPPDSEYYVEVRVFGVSGLVASNTTIRTQPAPTASQPLPTGPKNLRVATTSTTITATWDLPHPDAEQAFTVQLTDVESGLRVPHAPVREGDTSITITDLRPATEYRLRVSHDGIVVADEIRMVTTKSR